MPGHCPSRRVPASPPSSPSSGLVLRSRVVPRPAQHHQAAVDSFASLAAACGMGSDALNRRTVTVLESTPGGTTTIAAYAPIPALPGAPPPSGSSLPALFLNCRRSCPAAAQPLCRLGVNPPKIFVGFPHKNGLGGHRKPTLVGILGDGGGGVGGVVLGVVGYPSGVGGGRRQGCMSITAPLVVAPSVGFLRPQLGEL
ncbi:MAG: hypothetical protein M1835_004353 [Candelina submexicana]|nr:MAG: hypothetical protein M1835_004353 [Candelina submexicana]